MKCILSDTFQMLSMNKALRVNVPLNVLDNEKFCSQIKHSKRGLELLNTLGHHIVTHKPYVSTVCVSVATTRCQTSGGG